MPNPILGARPDPKKIKNVEKTQKKYQFPNFANGFRPQKLVRNLAPEFGTRVDPLVPNLAPKSGTSSVPKIGFGRYSQTDQSQARSSHRRRARMRARSHSEQASHFLGPLSVPALGDGFRPHFRGRIPTLISGTIFHICIASSGPGVGVTFRTKVWGQLPTQKN